MGGAAQGDLASQYAAEKVLREYYRSSQLHPGTRLRQAMRQVGNEIYHYAAENLGPVHMATTMVAATIWEDSLTIANVGDSRAYLIRNGSAQQLTRDHNLASELVRDGVITEEEAQNSPVKSRITRSLGGELDVFVDVFPDIPLRPGDRLLLCSDGLTRYARPDDLVPLATEGALEDAVKRMVDFANDAGGIDNTTVILIEIGEAIPEENSAAIGDRTDPGQPQPPRMDQDSTLPGIHLAAFAMQDTVRSPSLAQESEELPPFTADSLSTPASAETPAPKPSELADTLRTRPATILTTLPATGAAQSEAATPSASKAASSTRSSPAPGRRLQPHKPFGRYTPSLILVLGLIWLIGMVAVGGWFMYSRLRGGAVEANATLTAQAAGILPVASELPLQATAATALAATPTLLPSATAPVSPTLSADLTTTPASSNQGRTFCQIAVQPGENLSIITTKLGIALQYEAFNCAAGENGGCAYDPQQPDALREGWVMVFPDVDRGVCEGYNGTVIETAP